MIPQILMLVTFALLLVGCDQITSDARAAQSIDRAGAPAQLAQNSVDLPEADDTTRRPARESGPGTSTSVRVALARRESLNAWVSAEGTVRAVRREFLSFESPGRIAFVDDVREGDRVKKGHVIARQEQSRAAAEVASAQAALVDARTQVAVAEATRLEAAANLRLAQKTFNRFARLLKQDSASKQEYDESYAQLEMARAGAMKADRQVEAVRAKVEAQNSQVALARVTERESQLVAPIDGIISHLNIEQGYYFSPQTVQTGSEQAALDTVPIVIVDPGAYEIRVDIPAHAYGQFSRGAQALIEQGDRSRGGRGSDADDNARGPKRDPASYAVRGEVYSVSPSIDPATRTFQILVRTATGAEHLLDGEFVSVWIAGATSSNALTIPRGSTRFANGERFVFVVDPASDTVRRVTIRTGAQTDSRIEVLAGLEAGMQVVTDGRSQLTDGDRVRVIGGDEK